MTNYTLPHFGQLDTTNLEDYYDVDIYFNGHKVQIDLNFDNSKIDISRLDMTKKFIDNLVNFDLQNKNHIQNDYTDEDCDTVRTYIDYLITDSDKEELSKIPNLDNDSQNIEQQLVKALRLVRVGLYPDSENRFATFDYTVGADLTDDLVVIFTDQYGEMDYMTMES